MEYGRKPYLATHLTYSEFIKAKTIFEVDKNEGYIFRRMEFKKPYRVGVADKKYPDYPTMMHYFDHPFTYDETQVLGGQSIGRQGSIPVIEPWEPPDIPWPPVWVEVAPQVQTYVNFRSLCVYNNKLYGGTNKYGRLYEWNGTDAWVLKAPQLGSEAVITSLCEYNNKLYGYGHRGKLYEWNNSDAWVEKAPILGSNSYGYSLCVYNSKLYGGNGNGELHEWNDTNAWVSKAPQLGTESPSSLCVYNNKLYAGTYGTGCLYEWNGTNAWTKKAPRIGWDVGNASPLCIYNNKLYAGTNDGDFNGTFYEWNGSNAWVLKGDNLFQQTIEALAVYNGELYGGGYRTTRLHEWDETDEWGMMLPHLGDDNGIRQMIVYNNKLYGVTRNYGYLYEWNGQK